MMRTSSIGGVIFLFALVLPLQGVTQTAPPDSWAEHAEPDPMTQFVPLDPHPLRPADTSSPRATLNTFLNYTNSAIQLWLSGTSIRAVFRRGSRAVETLNLSEVVDPHRVGPQVRHVLLLKEILDRVELPPEEEIPDAQMVADQEIVHWAIPDTPITISQVQDGARAGEFLFSPRTVKGLERLYLRSKHLPYQPGATTEGVYEYYLEREGLSKRTVEELRNRLKPLDTSSPRSTYIGFVESLKRAYGLIKDADAALRANPPTIGPEEAEVVERDANILVKRAVSTLDLSEVPIGIREDVGIQAALQLKEVLDRVRQPFLDAIPGPAAVQDWKRSNQELLSITPRPFTWKLRNTEIQIVEVLDGPRAGEFLFSPRTVEKAGEFYHTMRDLPYRAEATEGFYRFFASTPGGLVPADYPLTRWIERLPPVFKKDYANQAVWQWTGLVLSIVAILVAIRLASRGIRIISRRLQGPLQEWLEILVPITVALVLMAVHEFIHYGLNITGQTLYVVTQVFNTIVYLMAAWLIYDIFRALSETFIASPNIPKKSGVDASLLRLGARVLSLIAGVWIVIVGIKQLGIDMFPLVAGLGVGGLAVALAARSTLENFMGTLNIYADRPVRVGDLCRYGEDPSPNWLRIGRIEEIGLRSTRIRGLDRTITTIPNAEFCNMHIVNLTKCDRMLFKKKIGLRLDTTPDQSRQVLAALREMLLADPRITDDPAARVRVCDYGPSSIDMDIVAYVNTVNWNDFLAVQEDLVLRIMDIVKEAGTALALPPRILYHRRDNGIDAERQKTAENQVRE